MIYRVGRSKNGAEAVDREKISTQIDAKLLEQVRDLAQGEGRQLQVLFEEALSDLLEKRQQGKPRVRVMDLYRSSHNKFAPLYRKLAE